MKFLKWNSSDKGKSFVLARRQFLLGGALLGVSALATSRLGISGVLAAEAAVSGSCGPIIQFSTDITPLIDKSLGSYAQLIGREMDAALTDALKPETAQTAAQPQTSGQIFVQKSGSVQSLKSTLTRTQHAHATRLVVRLDSISMASYSGGSGGGRFHFGGGGNSNDELEGVGLLYVGGSKTPKQYPILAVLDAGSGGAWYDPKSEGRRVTAICHHFAWWLNHSIMADSCLQG